MAPSAMAESELDYPLYETDGVLLTHVELDPAKLAKPHKHQIIWRNLIAMILLHVSVIYDLIVFMPGSQVKTVFYSWFIGMLSSLGIQAGAHRLWCHRSYKASFGLRVFLMICQTMALQDNIYEWTLDHRAHHRFSETDADPHNSSRGFFYSHMGWLLVKRHPDYLRRAKTIDMTDVLADPVVRFQRKYYIPLVVIFYALLPALIPWYFFGEPFLSCLFGCVFTRHFLTLHHTFLVNSWSHMYGTRPYDSKLAAVEASIRHFQLGEGFHNFHHAFPWDYSASELGPLDVFNPCTACINLFAKMGSAWDLKKVKPSLIAKKMECTGNPKIQYRKGTIKGTLREWTFGLLGMFSSFIFFAALALILTERSSAYVKHTELLDQLTGKFRAAFNL